jgi:hypothetical protein
MMISMGDIAGGLAEELLPTDTIVAEVWECIKTRTKPSGRSISVMDILRELRAGPFKNASFIRVQEAIKILKNRHVIERVSLADNGMWRITHAQQTKHAERKEAVGLEPTLSLETKPHVWEGPSDLEPLPIVPLERSLTERRVINARAQIWKVLTDLAGTPASSEEIGDLCDPQIGKNSVAAFFSTEMRVRPEIQRKQIPSKHSVRPIYVYWIGEDMTASNDVPATQVTLTEAATTQIPTTSRRSRSAESTDTELMSMLMQGVYERAHDGTGSETDWAIIKRKMGLDGG